MYWSLWALTSSWSWFQLHVIAALIDLLSFSLNYHATLFHRNQWKDWEAKSLPTSGKFCSAKALAMLWSSVQLMASAIASTPRQFAAVNCFSGVNKQSDGEKDGERMETQKERHEGQRNRNNKETQAENHNSNIYKNITDVERKNSCR